MTASKILADIRAADKPYKSKLIFPGGEALYLLRPDLSDMIAMSDGPAGGAAGKMVPLLEKSIACLNKSDDGAPPKFQTLASAAEPGEDVLGQLLAACAWSISALSDEMVCAMQVWGVAETPGEPVAAS